MTIALAGCAGRVPAPIEHRGAMATRGAERPPVAATPSPVPVVPAVNGNGAASAARAGNGEPAVVQTVPVRPSAPIESRPLGPAARPSAPAVATAPANAPRGQPRGVKQPYSDAAAIEMARADVAARATEAKPAEARPADPKAADPKAADTKGATDARPARASEAGWIWPAEGRVLQGFDDPRSKGIAIGARAGDPVAAAADGRVIFSGTVRGYGNLVIVKHGADLLSVYAHNRTLAVKEGDSVRRGQKIAEVGDSDADRTKLHFEVRRQGKPVDPMTLLPAR